MAKADLVTCPTSVEFDVAENAACTRSLPLTNATSAGVSFKVCAACVGGLMQAWLM